LWAPGEVWETLSTALHCFSLCLCNACLGLSSTFICVPTGGLACIHAVAALQQRGRTCCASCCRCGPFPPALKALQDARVKRLVAAMVSAEYSVSEGVEAIEKAKTKGVLKVVITMDG
jgi:hypothetical protein